MALIIKLRKNIGKVLFFPFKLIDSPDSALIIHADDAVFCAAVSGNAAAWSAPRLLLSSQTAHHPSSYVNLIPNTPLHALLSHNSNCIWPFDSSVENAL